jgi:hypothetical protein
MTRRDRRKGPGARTTVYAGLAGILALRALLNVIRANVAQDRSRAGADMPGFDAIMEWQEP